MTRPAIRVLIAGTVSAACAGTTDGWRAGPPLAADPGAARAEARRASTRDPVAAGARAWIEGNDRAAARRAFSAARDDDPAAALWSAWLAYHELDRDRAMADATRTLELAPDSPEGWVAAGLVERLVDEGASPPAGGTDARGAIGRALSVRQTWRAAGRGGGPSRLERGGWLVRWRVEGPLGLDDPVAFGRWIESGRPPPAPHPGPVLRAIGAADGRVPLAAGGRPGLYAATTCFGAPPQTELWARFPGEAELTVDGLHVEPSDHGTWRARLALDPGVHRLRVRARAAPGDALFVVIGGARSAPCPTEHDEATDGIATGAEPRGATGERARVKPIAPTDFAVAPGWAGRYLRAVAATLELFSSDPARERGLAWVPERASSSAALLTAWSDWADERAPTPARRAALETAVRLDPTNPTARIALGRAAWEDESAYALRQFRAAATAAPEHWRPHWLAHLWLAERGRAAAALEELELALARDPPDEIHDAARSHLARARRLERMRRPATAGGGDASARAPWSHATARWRAGDLDGAVRVAYPAARASPSADRWAAIARWELGRGAYGRSGAAAQRALELDPLHDDARRTLLQAAAALGDRATFTDALERLRATGGADLQVEKLAASVLGDTALLETADSWVGRSLAFDPQPFLEPAPGRRTPRGVDPLEPWAAHDHAVLLNRVIDHVRLNGSVASEQHAIVRVQTRSAVDAFGEVAPPPNAVLLELRTLEPDGSRLEADRHVGKTDLSLPRLSPGDAVERRWLALEGPSTPHGGYVRRFFFGTEVPTARSDLVVIVPEGMEFEYRALNGAPEPYVRKEAGRLIHIWQSSLQPAVPAEPFAAPAEEFLPHVVAWAGLDERRSLAANLATARRLAASSWYVDTSARALVEPAAPAEARLAVLETWVRDHVEPGPPRSPLETLLARSGSRTALLVAMARAVGVDAELVALRPGTSARVRSSHPNPDHFELLAGRARIDDSFRWWILDDGFDRTGRLPAELRGGSCVVATRGRPVPRPIDDAWIDSTPRISTLRAELHADGTLTGTVTWALTERHAAELAEFDRRVPEAERPERLERALGTAWPGIEVADVRVSPAARRLEARLEWRDFARPAPDGLQIDDLFSELPLGQVFGEPGPADFTSLAERQTPLLVRESRELLRVRLSLPAGLTPRELPRSFRRITPFGSFERRAELSEDGSTIDLLQAEWLPQIRVQPEDYPAFRQTLEVVMRARRGGLVLVPTGRFPTLDTEPRATR